MSININNEEILPMQCIVFSQATLKIEKKNRLSGNQPFILFIFIHFIQNAVIMLPWCDGFNSADGRMLVQSWTKSISTTSETP